MPPPLAQLLLNPPGGLYASGGCAGATECRGAWSPSSWPYQAEYPDSVSFEDGCLAGGGRGTGCCAGAQCRVCEPNQVTVAGVSSCAANSCQCEPRRPPGSVQFRVGQNTCVGSAPPGGTSSYGQTNCIQCPPGTFNPSRRKVRDVPSEVRPGRRVCSILA